MATVYPSLSRKPLLLILVLFLSVFSLGALASSGDRQKSFRTCVRTCIQTSCTQESPPLPLYLRLLQWTCESNCDYHCQRQITVKAQMDGQRVHQYHGKWPFIRVFGIQEPASVVFSVLNGFMHLQSYKLVNRINRSHPMRRWLKVFVVLGTWSWFCSAVFHTRDFPITEKLDYFSAGLNVLYILFLGTVRMLRLQTWRETKKVALICALVYLLHIMYLLVDFDYGYNMVANATVGLLSNVVWIAVAVQAYLNRQPFWWKPAVLILLTDLAFSLELFDFPPFLDTFDAHALWHAATIPIVAHWYDYLVKDARWDTFLDQQRKN
ncbi:hypothetical protein LPJ64_004316 [Coemansia asiatica]|uniref:Post-GPI attachment to proteins factor 3 n=1 Tax=Coemansia asiatica TaxID=1052880 RepID=A0A9W8CJ58_9FUNG|nr:hypothetical protein LPJ64_004316 [Coemansia asiatica]KAJ2885506.1 hypothetical protein FB639_001759 [Coemansia asiatica]